MNKLDEQLDVIGDAIQDFEEDCNEYFLFYLLGYWIIVFVVILEIYNIKSGNILGTKHILLYSLFCVVVPQFLFALLVFWPIFI